MSESGDKASKDDFEVEITDIPHDEMRAVPARLLRLGAHFSPRSSAWRVSTIGGLLLLVFVVLVNTFPTLFNNIWEQRPLPAQVSSTGEQARAGGPLLYMPLGLAPRTCPSIAPLHDFDPAALPPGAGATPVWIVGFTGPYARLVHLDPLVRQPQPEGWAFSLMLVVSTGYTGFVILSGQRLQGDEELQFDNGISIATQDPITTFFVLYTNHPIAPLRQSDGHWRAWRVPVFVPIAGCYSLMASWRGGSWQINFAVGR